MKQVIFALMLFFAASVSATQDDEFLPGDEAFKLAVQREPTGAVTARLEPAAGYYFYRDRIHFTAKGPEGDILLSTTLPRGEIKTDPSFGDVEIYHHAIEVQIATRDKSQDLAHAELTATYQGCSERGLCYPPITKTIAFADSDKVGIQPTAAVAPTGSGSTNSLVRAVSSNTPESGVAPTENETAQIAGIFQSGNFWLILASFFGFGLLLALTPCVFPMIPILSGIIVGQGENIGKSRAFTLSCAYVLGMAITYSAAGVAAGLSGKLLSNALQNGWVLGGFALVFVALSLSMFGFYEIQMPSFLQGKVSDVSNKIKGGNLAGVFAMGAFSALIVGPCVAPPLAGALLYISQTNNVVLGGVGLFAMALGMGAPLLLIGTSAGALLPRAGGWMNAVKKVFGVMLLGIAIWLVSPVIPALATMLLLAALLVVSAIFLSAIDPLPGNAGGFLRLGKGVGVLSLLAGSALFIGALSGSRDILQPLGGLRDVAGAAAPGVPMTQVKFERVADIQELERRLTAAQGKPVVLDFYADWCVSCKEMEHNTFSDGRVQARLKNAVLLQADVTANKKEHEALLKRFNLFGPPGIVFFDGKGGEVKSAQVIGYQEPSKFLATLQRVPGMN